MSYLIYRHLGKLGLIADEDDFEKKVLIVDLETPKAVSLLESPSGERKTPVIQRIVIVGGQAELHSAKQLVGNFTATGNGRYLEMLATLSLAQYMRPFLFTSGALLTPCDHINGGRSSPDIPWKYHSLNQIQLYGDDRQFSNLLKAMDATAELKTPTAELIQTLSQYNLLTPFGQPGLTLLDLTLPDEQEGADV